MTHTHTHTHTHPFNGLFSGTTQVSRYQKGGTNLDFTEARDSVRVQYFTVENGLNKSYKILLNLITNTRNLLRPC